jgi:hypothetical protein
MNELDVTAETVLETLAERIREGQCILFLGAGIHAAPPEGSSYVYPEAQRPPLPGELAEFLGKECHFSEKFPDEPSWNLMRVALCYENTPGLLRKGLVDSLERHLEEGRTPSPAVEMLAQLPFRIYVTTNYDRLLENALRKVANREPTVIVYDPTSDQPAEDILDEQPPKDKPLFFKMHGDLGKRESIVITDEDYITFVQRMSQKNHPVPETILFYMRRWPTLFIGYSLRDLNLRLLFRTLRWHVDTSRIPPAFSVDKKPDPLILKVWQDQRQFVTFVTEDLWACVPWLFNRVMGREYGS